MGRLRRATQGLPQTERLAPVKDGAILLDIARGTLVDEEGLLAGLRSGRLKATLHVFEKEPLADDHPLRGEERCIITAHLAGPVMTECRRRLLAVASGFRRVLTEGEACHASYRSAMWKSGLKE